MADTIILCLQSILENFQVEIKDIVEGIKKIRKQKGIKQQTVASELGITVSAYSMLETGQNELSLSQFLKVCKVLETHPMTFFYNQKLAENSQRFKSLVLELEALLTKYNHDDNDY